MHGKPDDPNARDNTGAWLARLRHDLVKPATWAARDLLSLGRRPEASDLPELCRGIRGLIDEDGVPTDAPTLWGAWRSRVPDGVATDVLDDFETALIAADRLARVPQADPQAAFAAAMALDAAFDRLARALRSRESSRP